MHKKVNTKLLIRFTLPYILIVLLVFAIQYISNTLVLGALKNNVIEIIATSFKNNIGVIEQNLDNVKEIAAIVAQNTAEKFEETKRTDKDYYSQLTAMKKELLTYYTGGSVIRDICIQSDKEDYLVNFNSAYSKRIYYYQNASPTPEITPAKLLETSEKANGFNVDNIRNYPGDIKVVPFFYPIPLLKHRTGSVAVCVSEQALIAPVNDILEKSGGTLQVLTDSGRTVFSAGNEKNITKELTKRESRNKVRLGGKSYFLFKEKGETTKWEYAILLPESYVLAKVQNYQAVSIIFNFIILILGFGICFLFTLRKSRSYEGLLELLEIEPEEKNVKALVLNDEYTGLSRYISKIKNENNILLEKGTQSVLRRILNGQLEKDDISKELKNHKVELVGPCFGVIRIRYTTDNAVERIVKDADSLIIGKIREIIPNSHICFTEKNVAAVIFSCIEKGFSKSAKTYAEKIEKELQSRYNIESIVGVSAYVTSPSAISEAYKFATDVVNYKFLMDEKELYLYEELPDGDDYVYPIEKENALFKSVREFDYESARRVLREIQEENFVRNTLGLDGINELLAELRASIKKICRMQTEYLEFPGRDVSVNHFFENAMSILYIVCSDNEEQETQSKGQKICREAKNYIELYYNSPEISLDGIAEEFRLHPNYLSALFKKHTGTTISSYLENIRIEKSIELLSSGKYTVNEVAASVGFSNDSTFRRCFKKVKGVSPSSYLK